MSTMGCDRSGFGMLAEPLDGVEFEAVGLVFGIPRLVRDVAESDATGVLA
jgi:hypothetical protein